MHIVVIGGGVSGLACAYRLRQAGLPVLLLEQSGRLGGLIESVEQDGFLFELGPQSFLSSEILLRLFDELGISGQLLRADSRAPRYVLLGGKLHRVPLSPPELLTGGLLSARTKWRLVSEAFRRTLPPQADESVADFVRRKFGNDLLERLVAPLISGIYAGDPEKLSLRSAFPSVHDWERQFGSILRGAMKSRPPKGKPRPALCTFAGGMVTLPRALGERLAEWIRPKARVVALRRTAINGPSQFELQVEERGRTEPLPASAVVLSTPTDVTGSLLAELSPRLPAVLAKFEYAPVTVVAFGYRREQIRLPIEGFGFLVPRREGLRTLGTVWNSSLFPGRPPEGMAVLTSFVGGATDPEICQWDEARIAGTVAQELARVLQVSGTPVAQIVRRHARALPQYNLGHAERIEALADLCRQIPGLFLAGNYFSGPSIGACAEHAFRTAASVDTFLAAGS